jgi:hypothetical protein
MRWRGEYYTFPHPSSFFLPTTTTSSTDTTTRTTTTTITPSTNIMDDTISSAGISPTNVMDDTNDDYTPEELAVVLGMYVRQLLLGSNTIRVQNALCHMFRDLECEPTSDDCEKLSVELLKFGMSRDVEEIK